MAYLLSSELVVIVHVTFVAFLFFGGLFLRSHPRLARIHAPCLVYAVLISVVGWPCPLTLLEQWLRALAGSPVYSGEFLPHYFWSRFGLTGEELPVAGGSVAALLIVNFFPYWRSFFPSR